VLAIFIRGFAVNPKREIAGETLLTAFNGTAIDRAALERA
jgi:hypothetical protein